MSLWRRCEVPVISELWTVLCVNANLQKVKIFLDCHLKPISSFIASDDFYLCTHKSVFLKFCIYSSSLGSQETIRTWDSWRSDTRKLQILQFGHSPLKKTCKVCLERKNNWQKSTHSHIPKFFWYYQMFLRGCIHELLPHDESRTCFWRVPRLDQCTVLWWVGKLWTKKKSSH